jgi:hypothetical protein
VDRVADLEEQVRRLTLALDDFEERLSQETVRANSAAAKDAAALRELEQRLAAATVPAGFGQGVAPGSAAILSAAVRPEHGTRVFDRGMTKEPPAQRSCAASSKNNALQISRFLARGLLRRERLSFGGRAECCTQRCLSPSAIGTD